MKNGLLNVIPAKTLKNLLSDVTECVADVLSHTFGPYGQNTLIQTAGSVYSTKDGWDVMQMIRVSDEKGESAIVVNALKKLIQDVARTALINAGDGTTGSTLGAAYLNKRVSEYLKTHKLDGRTIEDALTCACQNIEDELIKEATGVTDANMEDIIYRIALISTNWDEEVSGIIRDIYMETKNPIIKVEDSGTFETSVKYIEGYEIVGHLEMPNFYLTSPAKGLFEAEKPLILTFGTAVHKDKLQALILAGGILAQERRKLVIAAPSYDLDFLKTLSSINADNIQKKLPPVNVVPFKYFAKTAIDNDLVDDFTVATGGILLTHEFDEVQKIFDKFEEVLRSQKELESSGAKTRKTAEAEKKNEKIIDNCIESLMKIGGTCEKLTANDKYILASGLTNKNEEEFVRRRKNLEGELERKIREYNAESSLTEMVRIKRLRLGKMQCNMGVIMIGGFGSAHLKSKRESIDDATRACEVAYQEGYIMDGGMAIPMAAQKALEWMENSKNRENEYPTSSDLLVTTVIDFIRLFRDAFKEVACVLFNNKYDDVEKSMNLVEECMANGTCYDLINEKATTDLIAPVAVCREELSACLRLILVNATSNQFVFLNEDDLIRAIQAGKSTDRREDDEEEED